MKSGWIADSYGDEPIKLILMTGSEKDCLDMLEKTKEHFPLSKIVGRSLSQFSGRRSIDLGFTRHDETNHLTLIDFCYLNDITYQVGRTMIP